MLKIDRECLRNGGRGPKLWQVTVRSRKLNDKENYNFLLSDKHY